MNLSLFKKKKIYFFKNLRLYPPPPYNFFCNITDIKNINAYVVNVCLLPLMPLFVLYIKFNLCIYTACHVKV